MKVWRISEGRQECWPGHGQGLRSEKLSFHLTGLSNQLSLRFSVCLLCGLSLLLISLRWSRCTAFRSEILLHGDCSVEQKFAFISTTLGICPKGTEGPEQTPCQEMNRNYPRLLLAVLRQRKTYEAVASMSGRFFRLTLEQSRVLLAHFADYRWLLVCELELANELAKIIHFTVYATALGADRVTSAQWSA